MSIQKEMPDFMAYKDKFSPAAFIEKLSRVAKRAGAKFVYVALTLYYYMMSGDIPLKDKAIIIGALGYLISPLDVMPDAIPIAGLSDDLAVLLYVLNLVDHNVPDEIRQKSRAKLSKWFDADEMREVVEEK